MICSAVSSMASIAWKWKLASLRGKLGQETLIKNLSMYLGDPGFTMNIYRKNRKHVDTFYIYDKQCSVLYGPAGILAFLKTKCWNMEIGIVRLYTEHNI